MGIFDEPLNVRASEESLLRYNASLQDLDDSDPDPSDVRTAKSPLSASETAKLEAERPKSVFDGCAEIPRERAEYFTVPEEWEHPVARARRIAKMALPNRRITDDLKQRVAAAVRFDGAPEKVTKARKAAEKAIQDAIDARDAAGQPERPRFAISTEAKDGVVLANAKATDAVRALEAVVNEPDVQAEWFDAQTLNIESDRIAAAEALEAAVTAYSAWRQAIATADALARHLNRFGDWHHHPDELEFGVNRKARPLELIGALRDARDYAKSDDDFISGRYLTTDYEGLPPHTEAYLRRKMTLAAGGSYTAFEAARLVNPQPGDPSVLSAIAHKDIREVGRAPIPDLSATL